MSFSQKHPQGEWKSAPPTSGEQAVPGLAIYRFGANLYYANESRFTEEILGLVKKASPSPEMVLPVCINDQ